MMKIIEARLPLNWLIGSASVIVFSLGGIYVKIDALGRAIDKQEKVSENQQRQIDNNTIEIKKNDYGIGTAFSSIAEVKANFTEFKSDFKLALLNMQVKVNR